MPVFLCLYTPPGAPRLHLVSSAPPFPECSAAQYSVCDQVNFAQHQRGITSGAGRAAGFVLMFTSEFSLQLKKAQVVK